MEIKVFFLRFKSKKNKLVNSKMFLNLHYKNYDVKPSLHKSNKFALKSLLNFVLKEKIKTLYVLFN